MSYNKIATLLVIAAAVFSKTEAAHAGSDISLIPTALIRLSGVNNNRLAQASCKISATDTSYMGLFNRWMCRLNNAGLQGLTGSRGISVGDSFGTSSNFSLHALVLNGPTISGVTYTYETQIWGCYRNSQLCSARTNFKPLVDMVWTPNSSGGATGIFVHQLGLYSGSSTPTGIMRVTFNTSASPQTLSALILDNTTGLTIRVDSTKTSAGLISMTELLHSATLNTRLAAQIDTVQNTGGYYVEGNGTNALQANAQADSPGVESCFTRASNGATDFTYTSLGSTAGCSVPSFPAYAHSQLANETLTTVGTLGTGFMNGMGAYPENL